MSYKASTTKYRLHLGPMAVAAIVAATGIPIAVRGSPWWQVAFDYRDIVNNLLLYLPLGVALWRRPLRNVIAAALLLASTIEFSQLWSIGRFASPVDVAANVLGAVFGTLAWRHPRIRTALPVSLYEVNRSWVAVAVLTMVTIYGLWSLPVRSSSLSNWIPDYPLQLGNEATQDRPWHGQILELALIPSAVSSEEALTRTAQFPPVIQAGPVIAHGGSAIALPAAASRDFAQAAIRANSFTVATRVKVANTTQGGPARIVSFSADPLHGNFDLGQDGRQVAFRVSRHMAEAEGERIRTDTPSVLAADEETLIVGTFDGAVARIYVNGRLLGRNNLAAAGCVVANMCESWAPIAWASLGGLATVIALWIFPWHGRPGAAGVALLAAAGALALPRALDIAVVPIATLPWAQPIVLIGALAVAFSASIIRSNSE